MTSQPPLTLIAVLGVTGAGKSTFINKASRGKANLREGHTMRSCTQTIAWADCIIDQKPVTLIDTPGFDDTQRNDTEILEDIAKFLRDTYAKETLLTGIILLQQVTHNRVGNSEARRTRLFEQICGRNAYSNVILATTHWEELNDQQVGNIRVEERKTSSDFWGEMLSHGAKQVKHLNTCASAQNIIRMLMNNTPKPLQMQVELDENGGELYATSAGQQLHFDLRQTSQKESQRLDQLLRELRQTRVSNDSLRQEIEELRGKVQDLESQKIKLENSRIERSSENSSGPAWLTALATASTAGLSAAVLAPYLCSIM